MVDILHRIGVTAPLAEVHTALTTLDGLAGWWADDVEGDPAPGGVVQFHFLPGDIHTRTVSVEPDRVVWEVVDTPDEWVGTTIEWELRQEGDWTIVLFAHRGWSEPGEFMHHCSTKWAIFLMSLKALVEKGKGDPSPHDVQISDWH